MKHCRRNAILPLFFLLLCFSLNARTYFTGYAGAGAIAGLQDNTFKPSVELQGFFNGQIEFSPNILLRMNFSGFTGNILGTRFSDYTAADFYIDGISLSYHHTVWDGFHNYVSIFYNEEDPIGSDTFLRRYFGINPISSNLTQTLQGTAPLKIYPMSGAGISYTVRFPSTMAAALYAYASSPAHRELGLNMDVRFGGKWDWVILDAALGINADGKTRDDNGNSVILLVKTVTMRAALTMLIGRETGSNLFMQAGIYRGLVYPASSSKITIDDIFLLFEPRIRIRNSNLNLTFFIFPKAIADRLLYTTDPIGFNLAYRQDSLFAQNISGGINCTVSSGDPLAALSPEKLDFAITPFLGVKTRGGDFEFMFKINPLRFDEISKALMFTIGYKTQL